MSSEIPNPRKEKGELIYDESNIEEWGDEMKKYTLVPKLASLLLIIMGLALLGFVFYDLSIQGGLDWINLFLGAPFALFIGWYGLTGPYRIGYLKVYEKGIKHPVYKSFKDARANNEYFIPFKDITEVYLNTKHNLSDIALVGDNLDDGVIHLKKQYIYNFDKFVESIEGKVRIVENRDWNCDQCKS